MFVAWNPGPADPPPGVLDVIARTDRRVSFWVGGVEYAWTSADDWRIPVADLPNPAWEMLPMVGGLTLVNDSGGPVSDGSIPPTRPETP